ncbi:MAG: DUF3429 domain-containing protein [Rhodobacteraceae bacterium]|nr:DUF3429 domain-containing protein [Paracoccaceae bacterium]
MKSIPFSAALWGITLSLPFIYCALAVLNVFTPPQIYGAEPNVLLPVYGIISLAGSGGIYWGFVAKSRPGLLDSIVAILPPLAALGIFFSPLPLLPLAIVTASLIVIDMMFVARGLAPRWWFSLRLFTTSVAAGSMFLAYYA